MTTPWQHKRQTQYGRNSITLQHFNQSFMVSEDFIMNNRVRYLLTRLA